MTESLNSDSSAVHFNLIGFQFIQQKASDALDDNIGRILKFIDDDGLRDNTVVIYSSDQGFYLGEHGWFDKRFMYEESLLTPFIVRWPGKVTPGTVNTTDIISNVDFAETFLDIAGIAIPGDMQGRSMVPVFEGNTPSDWRKSFYYQYYQGQNSTHSVNRHYGVTTGRYKLIYFNDADEWEFYDLKKDPDEMINQYYIPENDSIITALKAELDRLRAELGANEGNFATPDLITPMQWTTPLPLVGCADPNYLEYDPEVDTPDAGACLTTDVTSPGHISPQNNRYMQVTGKGVKINVQGAYSLYVYDLQGNLLQIIKGRNPAEISVDKSLSEGLLLYKLKADKVEVNRRAIRI